MPIHEDRAVIRYPAAGLAGRAEAPDTKPLAVASGKLGGGTDSYREQFCTAAQIAPSCLYIFIKSKLFQASTILPSLIRVMTMPVNSTGAWVALNPKLSPACLPRTLQRVATISPSAI